MTPKEQARYLVNIHGDGATDYHLNLMKTIKSFYNDNEEKAIKNSMSYSHLIEVKQELENL